MAGEVPAATVAPPAQEQAWCPSTMSDVNIEALVDGAAFSLRQGGKYTEAIFKDNNKRWAEELFVVVNPTPTLPPRTSLPPVLNARWEEKPTEEDMVEVEMLLTELQKLKAEKLTGAAVALLFAKRLIQLIQEWVHPGYKYSGREDPTRGQNRKVLRSEAHKRVMLIVSGEVRDKGCPKAYCLKRPTTEEKIVSFWCPAPLSEGQQGKAVSPHAGLALPAADVGSYSSDSSIGSESDDVVEVPGTVAGEGSITRKQRPTLKVEAETVVEKSGLTAPKPEEEDQEEERGWPARSPARVARSLPSAVLLKPSFSVQRTGGRASLSDVKRKADESTSEAVSTELAKGEASPAERLLAHPRLIEGAATQAEEEVAASEPPQGDDVTSVEVVLGDGAMAGVVEDPADPNARPRVVTSTLPAVQEPPKEKAPRGRQW
ncbi:hypothetical protein C2845_PM01G43930 [Panicum miliaceum]|uniref:Uncharacterized protein n=1 Tax=Panicum miliaceum TaxID=4540 RepID=A0A3L6TEY6_PANMI|nr:hypothetical protein C2845_PM01G43930 [Panicum miliaceum]